MLATIPSNQDELNKYYNIVFKEVQEYINPYFAVRRGATIEDLEKIKAIHCRRLQLFEEIEAETDQKKLKELAKKITQIDFELQDGWHFERNQSEHTWWFNLPKCSCPKMDNYDRLGTNSNVIDKTCLLHGE